MKSLNERILAALRLLRDEGPYDRRWGICAHVRRTMDTTYLVDLALEEASAKWPGFSGDCIYPVPFDADRNDVTPMAAYENTYDKWLGEYGDRRKQLLHFLCAYFLGRVIAERATRITA